jgi:hypothetical protein
MSNPPRRFPPGGEIDAAPSRPQQILMSLLGLIVLVIAVGLPGVALRLPAATGGARPKS